MQMAKLHCSYHFYASNGGRILADHLLGSTTVDDGGKCALKQQSWTHFICFLFCFQTLLVQVKCFQEIISIGYSVYRVHNLPWFRSLSWYMLIASNYFFYGESLMDNFGFFIQNAVILIFFTLSQIYKVSTSIFLFLFAQNFMSPLLTYHRFISFSLYVIGFIWFVLSLVKKYYLRQFSLVGCHSLAFLVITN